MADKKELDETTEWCVGLEDIRTLPYTGGSLLTMCIGYHRDRMK